MQITPYHPSIRESFADLLTAYFEELDAGIPESIVRGSIMDLLDRLTRQHIIHMAAATQDSRIIGFVICQIDSEHSDWCKRPGWGCIRECCVKPGYRGSGIGRRLAAWAEQILKSRGATEVYLTADTAQGFWLACGYSNTHEICSNDLEIMTKKL